jgi:hypothetical protein
VSVQRNGIVGLSVFAHCELHLLHLFCFHCISIRSFAFVFPFSILLHSVSVAFSRSCQCVLYFHIICRYRWRLYTTIPYIFASRLQLLSIVIHTLPESKALETYEDVEADNDDNNHHNSRRDEDITIEEIGRKLRNALPPSCEVFSASGCSQFSLSDPIKDNRRTEKR